MKIVSVILFGLLVVLPAAAQPKTFDPQVVGPMNWAKLWKNVKHAVNIGRTEWADLLHEEENQIRSHSPLGSTVYVVKTKEFQQHPVPDEIKDIYQGRVESIKLSLLKNELLDIYTFQVPYPEDLADLSEEQLITLKGFLEQSVFKDEMKPAYSRYAVKKAENGVIQVDLVTFSDAQQGMTASDKRMILRMDASTKKVIFFYKTVRD